MATGKKKKAHAGFIQETAFQRIDILGCMSRFINHMAKQGLLNLSVCPRVHTYSNIQTLALAG